jgi:predicted RNA-binding Zn-ribbon protein involved in translation (DUF1610 family)
LDRIFSKVVSFNRSGLGGCLISLILFGLFLGAIGLGWLVHGLLIIGLIALFLPPLLWFAFSWWLKRKIVQSECPVCQYEFMSFKSSEFACPSCGESLVVEGGKFKRLSSLGAIDVQVVDVVND